MKRKTFLLVIFALPVLIFFSCKKESTPGVTEKSAVVIKEIGAGNSKIAYPGTDLHLDADINAPGKVADVKVQITLAATDYGWDFQKTYTDKYAGLKKANFHEHADIPMEARAGIYTLLIIVRDEQGEKVQSKMNFEIRRDATLPLISAASLKLKNADMLNLTGSIQAPGKIDKLEVEVQSSAWTRKYTYTDVDMVNRTSYQLNKDIDVAGAPSGHYHINVRLFDQVGKTMFYQFHLDK